MFIIGQTDGSSLHYLRGGFFWDQTYTIVVIRPLIEVGGSFKGQKRSHRAQGQGDENFFVIEYAFLN